MTKIMLVEDSKFLRIATERALARAGYVVRCAEDGEQAIRMAQEFLPDLILLDMLLPKISGHDVLIALKKEMVTANIPVVVLSGLSQKNADRLHADGAFAFLEKSTLEMDKSARVLLATLAEIIKRLPRQEAPAPA
jgi:two-component system, OmpR family, alkaline phosphatase synthesis response regulator PhoP